MLEIISTMLRPSGASILSAQNGFQALDCFQKSAPGSIDMILMDVRMPVMNGMEAAGAIRRSDHPDSSRVTIVALTAGDDAEEEERVCSCGMNAYVKKPIDYFYLLDLMDRYMIKNETNKD